jgi:hypothetical protein
MGTSSRRSAPSSSSWRKAKRHASGLVSTGSSSASITPKSAISSYLNASGGGSALIGGVGGGGSGGRRTSGTTAIGRAGAAAQVIGSFLGDVATEGLDSALQNQGLGDLIGKSPEVVITGIVDALSGNGATLSDAILRAAHIETLGDVFDETITDYDSLRDNWEAALDAERLLQILEEFLSNVIFQQWVSDMAENLENNAVSADILADREKEVKDFIKGLVSFELGGVDALKVDWQGEEGANFISECLKAAIELMEE